MIDLQYPQDKLREFRKNFFQELKNSEHGQTTSLAFIKHHLPQTPLANPNEKFQVLVIGGTNAQTALVAQQGGKIKIFEQSQQKLPILKTKKILFDSIQKLLHPQSKAIAINFAFPLRPVTLSNRLDGIVVKGNKEHNLLGLSGRKLGQDLESLIQKKFNKTTHITTANDTICLTMAGLEKANNPLSLIGMVLGTGSNQALFLDTKTIVNLESGNFSNFSHSKTGQEIDQSSNEPGNQCLEKEIAGAYLYKHFNLLAKNFGIYSKITETKALNQLAKTGSDSSKYLSQQLNRRSASLVASMLAAIFDFKNHMSLTILVEGSVFWKGHRYPQYVNEYLHKHQVRSGAINFLKLDNSSIIGAARLATYTL